MQHILIAGRRKTGSSSWRPGLTQLVLVSYFALFGVVLGATGVLWDALQEALHLSDGSFGTTVLVTPLAGVLVLLATSSLTTWASKRRLALLSLVIIAAAQLGLSLATGLWVFVAVRALTGVGFGLLDGIISSATVDWEQRTGRDTMNVMHAAVSGGAVLGALAAGTLLNAHWSYQHVLVTLALLSLLIGVVTARVQFPPRARMDAPVSEGLGATLAWMTRRPRILVLVMLCLLAASGEALVSFWSVIHLRNLGASLLVSGAAFALFNGAMFIGRLLNALVVAHCGTRASLTLSGGGVLVATALLTSQRVPVVVAAFVVLGLAVAGVIPTLLSATARLSPGSTTSISSLILAASFTGYIVTPPVIGWAAAQLGLQAALLGTLGAIGLAMLSFIRTVPNETSADRRSSVHDNDSPQTG